MTAPEEQTEVGATDLKSRITRFTADPWPATTLVLTVIGLAIVLLTPVEIWRVWVYAILGLYLLLIMSAAGFVISLIVWVQHAGSRLRYGGVTNLIVIATCLFIGTLDTFSWMLVGVSILPGYSGSLLGMATTIVLFCIYSLWALQKMHPEQRKQ